MFIQLLAFFCAGIIIDLLVTRYTKSVAEKRVWSATVLSGTITFANFLLLTVIIRDASLDSIFDIMAYAGGNTVGTYVAMVKRVF
ncbi:MAG: hypothetical protein WAR22_14770 [Desulfomonilia bacterium]|jgi:hypothetical protein